MKTILSVCVFLTPFLLTKCLPHTQTRQHCCNLGVDSANSGLDCNNYQLPSSISEQDKFSCISSMKICCRKQYQKLECDNGIIDAKINNTCEGLNGVKSECCDACQLGINTGKTSESCQDELGLTSPSSEAFFECCKHSSTISTTITTQSTTQSTSISTKNVIKLSNLPPLENVCDIGDVCAQICIPTADSYKCACNKGFKLMDDQISCKPEKRLSKKSDNCSINNPCDHICIDTGVAVKCDCKDGFELAKDKRTCIDIDECSLKIHDCEIHEVCVNDDGGYYCDDPNLINGDLELESTIPDQQCPPGFKYNFEKLVCDDIDECQFTIICPRPKICLNTIGSFKCEIADNDDKPQCPPGFHFKPAIDACADIDECISGENDCNKESQTCLNTKGNYTCIDNVSRNTCPPGFKKNSQTNNCEDINECEENENPCSENEQCINEPGGHSCEVNQIKKGEPFLPLPPPDIPKLPPKPTINNISDLFSANTTSTTTTTTTMKPVTSNPRITSSTRSFSCALGYKYSPFDRTCIDIDECKNNDTCDSTQYCENLPGSFVCKCKVGFTKDFQTGACVDLNECQLGLDDCTEAQRCDNTIGSFYCARITGCGTGYTLNYANNLCEDDDECTLGSHNCYTLGPNFRCQNTVGSYRCEPIQLYTTPKITIPSLPMLPLPKPVQTPLFPSPSPPPPPPPIYYQFPKTNPRLPLYTKQHPLITGTLKKCLEGYIMNQNGQCEDIDECKNNPCNIGEQCINFNGRYECSSSLQCKIGYELNEARSHCVDIDECARGIHKCKPSQICKNGQGFYTCLCPPGHHIDQTIQQCVDIDECKYYKVCGGNAKCVNTIGSYRCNCNSGFRGQNCLDIDECRESSNQLCEHKCINLWGSYRCACNRGFILNNDNRTCSDINECTKFSDKKLCIGLCENIPGSYRCKCPKGYHLGSDGRTCKDIDECQQQNICSRDDICVNTNGGYKCYPLLCPPNYIRDPQHKGRCIRSITCESEDISCLQVPQQYTYNFVVLTSKLSIKPEGIQIFQINGPKWTILTTEFFMEIVDVQCPHGVEKVDKSWFRITYPEHNTMYLYLIKSIEGPQEIDLIINMKLYQQNNILIRSVVSHILIFVSEYGF